MSTNQSPESRQFGINFGHPDSAEFANDQLAKKGRVGALVIELTKCLDDFVDNSLGIMSKASRNKKLPSSGSKSKT